MVRRGGRPAAPSGTNSSTSSSNGSSQNGTRWSRSRPNSANSGEINGSKGTKSCDNSRSSPTGSSVSTSPPGKKSGGKGRSSSNWRARGSGSGRSSASGFTSDSKFSITNEDFPALPGVRGGSQSTPNKHRREKDAIRHGSLASNIELCTTDDSGVSSSSRGNTPETAVSPPIVVKGPNSADRKKSLMLSTESSRRKAVSDRDRAPRSTPRPVRPITAAPSFSSASPKKKSINAASVNTAPSFMKLSKLGQKIPERRGGTRVSSHQSPPSIGPPSPSEDSGKENDGKPEEEPKPKREIVDLFEQLLKPKLEAVAELKVEQPAVIPPTMFTLRKPEPQPRHNNYPDPSVPKIVLGVDGEMSNIPASMLTDQFGIAAMVPILDIAKKKAIGTDESNLSEKQKREKVLHENIQMLSVGIELNELGVPMKSSDTKTVWQTFAGPFGTDPLPPTCIGLTYYQVPSVYYTARTLMTTFDMSQNIPDKFGVHELFYIFYNLPKELWQVNAARELQYRGWRFNIKEKLWVHKKLGESDDFGITVDGLENMFGQKGANDVMTGLFEVYDPEKSRITSCNLTLRRSDFEIPAWEQRVPDSYQQMVSTLFPKEVLWGPREDRSKISTIPGMAGVVSAAGSSRPTGNKLANLIIPKQQPSARRLLSFADSPDLTPSFDSPFGTLPGPSASSSEHLYRQQMYNVILQKMQQSQMHQHQQHQLQQHHHHHQQHQRPHANASTGLPSSSSSSSFFQH